MRGIAHSDDLRAAVMAALMAGKSVMQCAREHDVPEATVRRWKELADGVPPILKAEKKLAFDELLSVYLHETITTLIEHQRMARDPEWFKKQNANDLGQFGGIHIDKVLLFLAAAERAAARAAGPEHELGAAVEFLGESEAAPGDAGNQDT